MAPHMNTAHHYGIGHGVGLGIARPKRHRKLRADNIRNISKASIRKLARRGGVKRIQQAIYQTTRDVLEEKVREVIRRVVIIVEHKRTKTATTLDIMYALRDLQRDGGISLFPVYGYGWPTKEFPDKHLRAPPVFKTGQPDAFLENIKRKIAMDALVNGPSTPVVVDQSHHTDSEIVPSIERDKNADSETDNEIHVYSTTDEEDINLDEDDDDDDGDNDKEDEIDGWTDHDTEGLPNRAPVGRYSDVWRYKITKPIPAPPRAKFLILDR